jgi:hypothetical protein
MGYNEARRRAEGTHLHDNHVAAFGRKSEIGLLGRPTSTTLNAIGCLTAIAFSVEQAIEILRRWGAPRVAEK